MLLLEYLIFGFLAAAVAYSLTFSVAGHFFKRVPKASASKIHSIVLLVPCYKEDGIIYHTAETLKALDYPAESFDVVIIADSCKESTLERLRTLGVTVIPVSFEKSSKSKSLNYALDNLKKTYDIGIILDADNVTDPDFLQEINNAFNLGYEVVQAQRVAKNTDTAFAILDASSEAMGNHISRKGANVLGFSANLIGSGMAFQFGILKKYLPDIHTVYEDRELQLVMAHDRLKVKYLDGVMVFDEKVSDPETFRNQRKRWFYAQFQTLIDNFASGMGGLFRGNFNYFNLAVLHNVFPPRLFTILFITVFGTAFTWLAPNPQLHAIMWSSLLILYVLSMMIAIPSYFYNREFVKAMVYVPHALFGSILSLIGLKSANKTFIHTPHSHTEIRQSFYRRK